MMVASMRNPKKTLEQQLVDVSDGIIVSIYFTAAGLMMALPAWLGGPTWPWHLAAAFCLLLSLVAAIQLMAPVAAKEGVASPRS
jgi:Kef-type K+ transport system membrane component KefB